MRLNDDMILYVVEIPRVQDHIYDSSDWLNFYDLLTIILEKRRVIAPTSYLLLSMVGGIRSSPS